MIMPANPTPDQAQEAILADLCKREPQCKRVDTHASIVLLGNDRVLKIKRAVRLPFLDYSTLEKRKQACEEELIVNRHLAPGLYRRDVPIAEGNAGFKVDGHGSPVEWAVEMSRFDESKTLDHLAATRSVAPDLAEAPAVALHHAHDNAPVSDGSSWLASLSVIIDRNTQAFLNESALAHDLVERLDRLSRQKLRECDGLLSVRASAGLVRRCHGDAHLGNIVLIDGKPILFDAIEFDPVIATTDILYDLAFPIMDFCHYGLMAHANRLLNGYLQATWPENHAALRLLPLFLSMRAAIRANVLFAKRHLSPGKDGDNTDNTDARAYFELALRCVEPVRPSLVAIGGKSGTGKSVLAQQAAALLAPLPGAVLLRSDVIRKQLFGFQPLASLPIAAYTADVTERVYRTLVERSRESLGQGISVVIDAAFLKQSERDELSQTANRMDVDFRALFLTADLSVRLERVRARKNDASDATAEIAAAQEEYEIGEVGWSIVDASGSPEQTLERSMALFLTA